MSEMLTVTEVDGVRVVTFGDNVTTGEAYDMTQCYDEVKDGDVLNVLAEGVVGVMVEAWPVAVSAEGGAFHALDDGFTLAGMADGKYAAAELVARSLLQSE